MEAVSLAVLAFTKKNKGFSTLASLGRFTESDEKIFDEIANLVEHCWEREILEHVVEAWNTNMKQLLHVLSFYDNVVTLFISFCSLFIHTNNTE